MAPRYAKKDRSPIDPGRRAFLRRSFTGMGLLMAGPTLHACSGGEDADPEPLVVPTSSNIANVGPLGDPDENGVRLPAGFRSRIVARSGATVGGSGYVWHEAPDGGATYPTDDHGWIYVSNCEHAIDGSGGVGAIRFSRDGDIVDAYRILDGTLRNCAGGTTPWGTWLSCEEHPNGLTWECDPLGVMDAQERPALGVFKHEAAAVDPVNHHVYLTEDETDGRFYRFTPDALVDGRADLSAGSLEVAQVVGGGPEGAVEWLPLPDPSASSTATREQVPESTPFDGGEGIWYHDGVVFFTTKGDNRVWAYDTADGMLAIVYDDDTSTTPILTGVDNITVSPTGDLMVAEDGGDMQVVAITPGGELLPLLQVAGHPASEITGPALAPDRRRLYFSSQRGASGNLLGEDGVTFEIEGPFFV